MRTKADPLRQAWGDWVAGMGRWDLFGGLTFDQRRVDQEQRRLPPQFLWREQDSWSEDPPPPVRASTKGRGLKLHERVSEVGTRLDQVRALGKDSAVKRVELFLQLGQQQLGRPIEAAVVALELHQNGWPHFHPLLRLAGGLQRGDIALLGPLWWKIAGYGRLSAPRSSREVAQYACKYVTKGVQGGEVVFWPRKGFPGALAAPLQGRLRAASSGRTR